MSALAAQLATPPEKSSGRCGIANWLESLDDVDRKAAENALESSEWRTVDLWELFSKSGLRMHATSLGAHRRKACSCL